MSEWQSVERSAAHLKSDQRADILGMLDRGEIHSSRYIPGGTLGFTSPLNGNIHLNPKSNLGSAFSLDPQVLAFLLAHERGHSVMQQQSLGTVYFGIIAGADLLMNRGRTVGLDRAANQYACTAIAVPTNFATCQRR